MDLAIQTDELELSTALYFVVADEIEPRILEQMAEDDLKENNPE